MPGLHLHCRNLSRPHKVRSLLDCSTLDVSGRFRDIPSRPQRSEPRRSRAARGERPDLLACLRRQGLQASSQDPAMDPCPKSASSHSLGKEEAVAAQLNGQVLWSSPAAAAQCPSEGERPSEEHKARKARRGPMRLESRAWQNESRPWTDGLEVGRHRSPTWRQANLRGKHSRVRQAEASVAA